MCAPFISCESAPACTVDVIKRNKKETNYSCNCLILSGENGGKKWFTFFYFVHTFDSTYLPLLFLCSCKQLLLQGVLCCWRTTIFSRLMDHFSPRNKVSEMWEGKRHQVRLIRSLLQSQLTQHGTHTQVKVPCIFAQASSFISLRHCSWSKNPHICGGCGVCVQKSRSQKESLWYWY